MIRILKEGNLPKTEKVIYRATCLYCDCQFEFDIDDCKEIERRLDGYMIIECPCCHKDIIRRR